MAHIVRIGDVLVNLEYLASVELARPGQPPNEIETVYMDRGRALYFEGEDAEAVRRLVRTFPKLPAGDESPPARDQVDYSCGSDVLADDVRKAGNGE